MNSFWSGVDALVDRMDLPGARAHRMHLLAARRWRASGRLIPPDLQQEEAIAAARVLAAPVVLARARAALRGPVLLMKGPEAAALYPDGALRPFADLDLLVPDAEAAQRALIAAGFEAPADAERYAGKYHLAPLTPPDLPLYVEVHRRPKGIADFRLGRRDPFSVAVPSRTGVDGISALPPPYHAVVLAGHSWAHEPLRRALDLVDVAATVDGIDRAEVRNVAGMLGAARVWKATEAAIESLLGGRPPSWPLRLWARNLNELRERTVLETHLTRWLSPFWALPPPAALRALPATLARELRPAAAESWGDKGARVRLAVRNARLPRSRHEYDLDRVDHEGEPSADRGT